MRRERGAGGQPRRGCHPKQKRRPEKLLDRKPNPRGGRLPQEQALLSPRQQQLLALAELEVAAVELGQLASVLEAAEQQRPAVVAEAQRRPEEAVEVVLPPALQTRTQK